MKLTTKRNRWYFFRELFLYLIPMILIVGTVDVFVSFMKCSAHPEWSAPCSINWILAAIYGAFLLLVIIFAIVSARGLRKVKKKIESEFLHSITISANQNKEIENESILEEYENSTKTKSETKAKKSTKNGAKKKSTKDK